MHGFTLLRLTAGRLAGRGLGMGLALGMLLGLGGLGGEQRAAAETPAAALAGTKPYILTIDKVTAKAGQAATVHVLFRAGTGWHVNKDFPTELRLKMPDGVVAQKATLTKADAKLTDEEGRFDVVLTGSQAGRKTVLGELRFAVCTATTCDPQKAPVSIELNVQ